MKTLPVHAASVLTALLLLSSCGPDLSDVGDMQREGDTDALMRVLRDEGDATPLGQAAAEALGHLQSTELIDRLARQVTGLDPKSADVAVTAASYLALEGCLEVLSAALEGEEYVGDQGHLAAAVAALAERADESPHPGVTRALLRANGLQCPAHLEERISRGLLAHADVPGSRDLVSLAQDLLAADAERLGWLRSVVNNGAIFRRSTTLDHWAVALATKRDFTESTKPEGASSRGLEAAKAFRHRADSRPDWLRDADGNSRYEWRLEDVPSLIASFADTTALEIVAVRQDLSRSPGPGEATTPGREAAKVVVGLGVEAVPPLVAALGAAHSQIRLEAVWALGELQDLTGLDVVATLLSDPDQRVRIMAAGVVGNAGRQEFAGRLSDQLDTEYLDVFEAVVRALGQLGGEEAYAALAALVAAAAEENLTDQGNRRRLDETLLALGRIDATEARGLVLPLLDHPGYDVSVVALRWFGRWGVPEDESMLRARGRAGSPRERDAARGAIERLRKRQLMSR